MALREQATLQGEVVYDKNTNVAKSVRLQRVVRGEQLVLGLDPAEFWRDRDLPTLAGYRAPGSRSTPTTYTTLTRPTRSATPSWPP